MQKDNMMQIWYYFVFFEWKTQDFYSKISIKAKFL